MMKKLLTLAVCSIMAMSIFTGCVTKPSIVDPGDNYEVNIDMTDADYNQTATLTIGVTADPYETDLITALAKGFNGLFPNVKIEPSRISGNDYSSAVVGRFQAGNMPDLFYTSETESFRFISSGLYLNLKPYINAQNAADSTWSSQFVEKALELGQKNYKGDQFFMPRSSDRIVMHLNMNHITPALTSETRPEKDVDVSTVKNGWTWEEFLKVVKNIRAYYDSKSWTAENGRYIVDASLGWDPVLFSFFKSMGASFSDAKDSWTVNSPEMLQTIELIRSLVENKYIAPYNAGGANYENGNGAMLIHSSSAIAKYSKYIGEGYDIVTFPTINGQSGVTGYGVPGYGIYSGIDASKRDLAWQFLSYMLSEEGQNVLAKAGMTTPSIRNDLQDFSTAAWGEGYRHLNLAATTFEPERNYSENFFLHYPATQKTALINEVKKFVNNIITYNVSTLQPSFPAQSCIDNAIAGLKKAAIAR